MGRDEMDVHRFTQVHVQPSFLPGSNDAFEPSLVIPEQDPSWAREADDVLQLRRGYQWSTGSYPQRVNPADHQMSHARVPRLALANVRPGVQLSGWRDGLSACSGIYPTLTTPATRESCWSTRARPQVMPADRIFRAVPTPHAPSPTKGWGHSFRIRLSCTRARRAGAHEASVVRG